MGANPGVFFNWTPHRLRWRAGFLHSCISNRSPECLKILSLCDLWLGRYDLVLVVMSDRIFAKFGISPKAQLWPKHFETCSVQYGYRTLQIVYLGFFISLTSGKVNFVTCPCYKSMGKIPQISISYLQIA